MSDDWIEYFGGWIWLDEENELHYDREAAMPHAKWFKKSMEGTISQPKDVTDDELKSKSESIKQSLQEMYKMIWESTVMSHKQTPVRSYYNSGSTNMFIPPARFIGGTWHSFDCMCPVCLQATMDEINSGLKTTEVKSGCECGAEASGSPAHSAWCPLYIPPDA